MLRFKTERKITKKIFKTFSKKNEKNIQNKEYIELLKPKKINKTLVFYILIQKLLNNREN